MIIYRFPTLGCTPHLRKLYAKPTLVYYFTICQFRHPSLQSNAMLNRRKTLLALTLCLLVAALLRSFNLASVPPGVHFDEAANGILANEIGSGGERPLFITSYTGKEVLYFYLAGTVMRLVNSTVWGLRLTAAYVGLLTVAATYWLGLELSRDRRVALFAAALLAVSFWHLLFSRLGFRAISQPLLQALMVAAWLRGVRRQQTGWLLLSGIFLGLSLYTYLAVRLFPLLLLVGSLPLLVQRPFPKQQWRNHLLLAGAALLVAAPLLFFFWQNPDAFWVRITQVSPDASDRLTVGESVLRSLRMFFVAGDPYIRFNIPFMPLLDPMVGTLAVLGWATLLLSWRRLQVPWRKTAVLFLLVAPFIMLLPTALATSEIVPSNLRAIGLLPFLFYLPAAGLVWVLDQLWLRTRAQPILPLWSIAIVLAIGGVLTYRHYFLVWGRDAALFLETDADLAAVAQAVDAFPLQDETLFVASPHYQHPSVAFLSERYDQIKWLPHGDALVFPAQTEALVFYPAKTPPPDWASLFLPEPILEETAVTAYRLTETPVVPSGQNVNFSNAMTLRDVAIAPQTEQNTLPITLFWQVNGALPNPVQPFVHLEDRWGHRWSQRETFAYPSEQWARGDLVIEHVELSLPPGLPPEQYLIKIGLFDPATSGRLAIFDEDGRYAGNSFTLENVLLQATQPPDVPPTPPIAQNKPVVEGLRLLGYHPITAEISGGETLPVVLHWYATKQLPQLTLRFELLREGAVGGRIVATSQPVHGQYPFPFWETPQYVIDHQALPIPESIEPGRYVVNLRVLDRDESVVTAVNLGSITLKKTERLFTPPFVENAISATFGAEIALHGYSLTRNDKNEYTLTLLWQALQPPAADYTVFVHALMPDGSCTPCVWQQDAMPQQNLYPTSRWQSGEYVVDTYQIELPPDLSPGIYPIEVGLYLADSGIRLSVETIIAHTGDALVFERIVVE